MHEENNDVSIDYFNSSCSLSHPVYLFHCSFIIHVRKLTRELITISRARARANQQDIVDPRHFRY